MTQYRNRVLVLLVLLTLLFQPATGQARPIDPPGTPQPDTEQVVIQLYVRDKAHLDAVAGNLDIWETHQEEGYIVAAVTSQQRRQLENLGYQTVVDTIKTAQLVSDRAPLDGRFYYFDQMSYTNPNRRYVVSFLNTMNSTYPTLTELYDIGNAYQNVRDMWVLRITNEDPAFGEIADKPAFFLYASVHAREVATPELAIRYIKYLLPGYNGEGGYNTDPDATWLVDRHVLYVLVVENPDGHLVNEMNTSANRRKNLNNTLCSTGRFGIDLNRNHSFMWGCCNGSSPDPCDDTYRGSSAASEPETVAFQSFFASVMRDQNGSNGDYVIPPAAPETAMGIFVSLHSYSDLVLWPWGFDNYGNSPNYTQLQAIGRKFAYFNDYNPDGSIWYDVDGATDDWTYGRFGIASFTFEVGPDDYSACGGFFPAYGCIEGADGMSRNFWAENKPAFIYAHKIAATPYRTVYGPDTLAVSVTPVSGMPGTPIALQATITDRRYSNSGLLPIAAAEYFLDTPGDAGTGIPMTPTDGAWGSTSEGAQATLDTSALAPGRHTVFVHGRNNQGKWGPYTAVFLTIEPPLPPCVPVTSATLTLMTPAPIYTDTVATFEATLEPEDFTAPYTYTLDFGAGPGDPASGSANPLSGLNTTFTSTGVNTATLALWSCGVEPTALVTATTTVEVLPHPVPPTYGVTLTPTLATRSAMPGTQVVYTLTVENTGNITDTVDLSTTGTEAWTTEVVPNVMTLTAGQTAPLTVTVALEPYATGADSVTITAASRNAPVAAQATLTTTALCVPVVAAPLAVLTAAPIYTDTVVVFEATLNPPNFTAPYTYTLDFGNGPSTPASSNANPLTGISHTFDATGVQTATLAVWNCGAPPSAAVTATATVDVLFRPVTVTYGISLTPNLVEQSSMPGAQVVTTLIAKNTGNTATIFDFNTTGEESWTTTISPEAWTLNAGETVVLSVTVTLDFNVIGTDVVTVTATSRTVPPVAANAVIRTTALALRRLYLPLILNFD